MVSLTRLQNQKYRREISIISYRHRKKGICSSNTFTPPKKPVDLLRYLVLTYTNGGDAVLDNCGQRHDGHRLHRSAALSALNSQGILRQGRATHRCEREPDALLRFFLFLFLLTNNDSNKTLPGDHGAVVDGETCITLDTTDK